MTHQFSVSDLGFRLIKAYEGYRPQSRILISGNNVVGYGHRIADQDAIALTRAEADMLLREDIQPVEELVNEAVFAPLTQGQFDALCSLAYNIGPDAFLKSDVIKAINNGRPIEAANGFDVWRKGEIDGESFIIDALVRRRTAEKALFLKPDRHGATSPRDSLPPKADMTTPIFSPDDSPVYTQNDAEGYVDQIPYDQRPNPGRRREDGPAGILELSEYYDEDADDRRDNVPSTIAPYLAEQAVEVTPNDNLSDDEPSLTLSPIAEAAAEVSDRLEALIDDQTQTGAVDVSDMPNSLLKAEPSARPAKVLPFTPKTDAPNRAETPDVIDAAQSLQVETTEDDNDLGSSSDVVKETPVDSTARFIENRKYVRAEPSSVWAFGVMMISGLVMFCLSLYATIKDPIALLGPWGAVAAMAGLIMGGLIILGSIYYILKSAFAS